MIIVRSEQRIVTPKKNTYYYTELWSNESKDIRIPCISYRDPKKKIKETLCPPFHDIICETEDLNDIFMLLELSK